MRSMSLAHEEPGSYSRTTYGRIAAVSIRRRVAFIPASMTAQSFSEVR